MLFGRKKKSQETESQATSNSPAPSSGDTGEAGAGTDSEILAANALAAIRTALENPESIEKPAPQPVAAAKEQTEEEKEREKDRSLYKNLLSGLYDAIIILDSRGTTIGSNSRAESFFGYDSDELWNKPCTEMISAITPRVLTKIQTHAQSGRFTVVSAVCTRKDGSTFPAEIAISKITLLHEGDLILSIRNQERKARADELHRLEQAALASAGAGIAVCTVDGMIELINPAMTKLLHLENSGEACKRFIGEFCTSHEAASALMRAPSTQGNWLGEMEIVTQRGITRKVLATAALSEEKKKKQHIVLTLTPIPTRLAPQ